MHQKEGEGCDLRMIKMQGNVVLQYAWREQNIPVVSV